MWEPNLTLSKALGLEEMQTEALLNKDKARPPAPADTQASKATLGTSVRETQQDYKFLSTQQPQAFYQA